MQRSIFSPTLLRTHNQQIPPVFETHWRRRWISPQFWGNFSFDPDGEAIYDRVEERVVHIVKDGKLQPFE